MRAIVSGAAKSLSLCLLVAVVGVAPAGAQNEQELKGAEGFQSSMDQRLEQVIGVIREGKCRTVPGALDLALATLYGGLRPLPSKGLLEETEEADRTIRNREQAVAEALNELVRSGRCQRQAADALDLKLFIEEMNEVAAAVGEFTRQCDVGDRLDEEPCDQLMPLLEPEHEPHHRTFRGDGDREEDDAAAKPRALILRPSFSVKLRGPFVPVYARRWKEAVSVTDAIEPGECAVVFKETRGLAVRLHLDRITIVRDPWAAPQLLRGTRIPIWSIEWVPAEYVKEWNICNRGYRIDKTVTRRVVQDTPLNFFWRYYH